MVRTILETKYQILIESILYCRPCNLCALCCAWLLVWTSTMRFVCCLLVHPGGQHRSLNSVKQRHIFLLEPVCTWGKNRCSVLWKSERSSELISSQNSDRKFPVFFSWNYCVFVIKIKMIISTDNDNNFSLTIMLPVRKTTNFYSSLF